MSNLLWFVYYASICSVLIPISTYIISGKRNWLRNIIFVLLMTSLISDVGTRIYVGLGNRGYLITNIFFVCQIILLCLLYAKMISNKKIVKIALWLFPFLALGCFFFQSIHEYQGVLWVIGGLIMISFAVRYFWQMYCYLPADDLVRFLKGWVNMAVFIYFAFNLFLFFCANFIFHKESTVVAMGFWSFHNLNNIAKNILLALGLYFGTEEYAKDPEMQ